MQEGFQHEELLPGHALLHEGAGEKLGDGTVGAREHDHERDLECRRNRSEGHLCREERRSYGRARSIALRRFARFLQQVLVIVKTVGPAEPNMDSGADAQGRTDKSGRQVNETLWRSISFPAQGFYVHAGFVF